MKHTGTKALSWLLSLAMVLSLLPGMSLTANATPPTGEGGTSSGGLEIGGTTHTHNDITFTAWTSTNGLPTTEGSYYLTADVTLSSTWTVPTGTTNLCLNGHKIDANGGAYNVLYVSTGATLNLYDEDGNSGKITGSSGNSSGYGGGVMVSGGGVFNMHGGTVTGNSAMMGGGVYIHADNENNTFTMSGGVITGNTAQYGGGGVEVGGGKFNLSGSPTITGNTGGNVYLPNGKTVTVGALTEGASIGVTMASPGVFTGGGIAKDYAANFTSDNSACSIVADGNELKLVQPAVSYIDHEADGTVKDGSCTSYTAITAGTNDTLTTIPEGWYVITSGEAVATQRLVVNGTVNLILCDGATLIARKGITVAEGNTLNIYAGSTGDTVLGTGKLYAGTNGTITTCEGEYAGIGGSSGAGGGTVTIHGGEVTARGYTKAAGIGGGNNGAGGTVKIYGGTVTASCDGAVGIGAGRDGSTNGTLTLGTGVKLETSTDNSTWTDTTSTPATRTQYMRTTYTPHTHSFTYSASGATITATCGTGCTLTSAPTLTIVAPTLTTYGETGKSAAATLTGLDDFKTATGKAIATTEIKYVGRDGTTYEESATAPTGAGKYTAKITVEGQTASVDYEIAKAAGGTAIAASLAWSTPDSVRITCYNEGGRLFPVRNSCL